MNEISKEFGELLKEGSGTGPEYTPEQLEAQTTNFLLAFIDQMQVSEDQKAKLRNNIIERALNPEKFKISDNADAKGASVSPEEIIRLICLVILVFGILGKI